MNPPVAALAHTTPQFCEGVCFDHDHFGYVSHGKAVSRFRVDPATGEPVGPIAGWAETGGPNGHKVHADGTHLLCDDSRHAVLRLDAAGKVLGAAADACEGKPLRAPNDLTLDPAGGFYFTDPGGSSADNPVGTVHHTDAAGRTTLVAGGLTFPNGIVLDADRKRLLVAETGTNRVLEFPVRSPGRVGPVRVFAELPKKSRPDQTENVPDGVCLDAAGNLYVAHYGMKLVQVLGPAGELVRSLDAGNVCASNVAFAPDRRTLYVTGGKLTEAGEGGVYRVRVFDRPDGRLALPPRVGR